MILRLALVVIALGAVACSYQNQYEQQAERMTRAVMANNLGLVKDDLAPGAAKSISPAQLAQWSADLNAQGKLESVTENPDDCVPGQHCFDVKFEKALYEERMQLDANGKILRWQYQVALPPLSQ